MDRLKLATALVQPTPVSMALKLMSCIFTKKELINGNPSGISKSSDQQRRSTIQKLDTGLLRYVEGIQYYY